MTRIRRRLRGVRVSALTFEERRQELREAELRIAQDGGRNDASTRIVHGPTPGAHADSP